MARGLTADEILALRDRHLGGSLSVSYQRPLHIVRGERQFLYDAAGRAYLDCVNNVCHVGHGHPRVVEAASRQMAELNTNTRYLHENIVEYARRLGGLFPDPLEVCFFVCSGSEANELALRLARTATGRRDVVVLDEAYHGHTSGMVDLSPYKFNGPGGAGRPEHVHVAPVPDPFRGRYRYGDPSAGERYARTVADELRAAESRGRPAAAFFAESVPGCAGQIVPPQGFLPAAFEAARSAGALSVADEVQVGFGRVGTHWWAVEAQGAVADIVTLGKPIGNGHPMGAVVTTRAIAEAFDNGMEFFNTFGGNPVSCAVGLAVLDVIEEEELMENARSVGERFRAGLRELSGTCPIIGDVRGLGLFIGVELVLDPETLEPAGELASRVVDAMRERGILLSTDGPYRNVIKIKPPLVFQATDADRVVSELEAVLAESALGVS
ncbi:MAG: aminotransferase class III-fold pyridoxal phosphate-dependent enzyme [Gemmatimonadota bacterium]